MINTVLQTIERYSLLSQGDCVLVALSGGADSVALLHCLNSIKEKYQLQLYAAHLNHLLRGEEAARDERFCQSICKALSIECFVKRVNIKQLAATRKISEELCGREERYRFFAAVSEHLNAKVATAHTASDNAETLLFNLTRGTSVGGAAGIPPRRGNIIRPLLDCTREDVERYCRDNALDYVTDSTNLSDDYTRNKLRHNVIPALKALNPQFEQAALRFSESAASVKDYIRSQAIAALKAAETPYGYAADNLLTLHEAVLHEVLFILIKKNTNISPETRHILLLKNMLCAGGAVAFGNCTAVCKQKILRFVTEIQPKNNLEIPLDGDISFDYRGKIISAHINYSNKELKLLFRTRRAGDTFTYHQRNVTKPLRKVFNELKIPDERRDSLFLLCNGSVVLWCEDVGFSAQGEALKISSDLNITQA